MSTASNIRLMRSGASGQYCPTTCSLSASPLPRPSQCRPGYIAARVADACATIAGCQRKVGVVTPGPRSPVVRLAERGQDVPDEASLALLRDPRLEVVGGHDAGEALALGVRAEVDRLGRVELLQHGGVADLERTRHVSHGNEERGRLRWSSHPVATRLLRFLANGISLWAMDASERALHQPTGRPHCLHDRGNRSARGRRSRHG